MKKRLDQAKGQWVEELPGILWSARSTEKRATRETPFRLAFDTEVIIPAEIGSPSFQIQHYSPEQNEIALRDFLDLLPEVGENALLQMAI